MKLRRCLPSIRLRMGGTRRAVASTSGAACTRGSVQTHCRAGGITPRNVPQRNPACGGWLGTVLARAYSTPVDSFRESNPLAAKGVLVQGAFSLMAQAFSNYHNAAMPAIVGTSKLLAALNLPLDSRAKQIAARLVLCPCRECSKGQSDGTSPDASRRRNRPASQKDKPTPKGHGRRRHNDV